MLNKAGRLVAQQHLILKNPEIPDVTAVKMAKPMAQQQARLNRVVGGPPDEEDDSVAEGALENMLRKIFKGTTTKQKAIWVTPVKPETATRTSNKKRRLRRTPATPLELYKKTSTLQSTHLKGSSTSKGNTTIGIGSSHHICLTASGDG